VPIFLRVLTPKSSSPSSRLGTLDKEMQRIRQKQPRIELSFDEYGVLRDQVLERDGWRCQDCGSSKDLQVHHLVKRSKLGDDILDNLIALCASCHMQRHGG
jgi:5-methylcytosine-specific restriction endonuclease McrA